jgi:hypothetical protein
LFEELEIAQKPAAEAAVELGEAVPLSIRDIRKTARGPRRVHANAGRFMNVSESLPNCWRNGPRKYLSLSKQSGCGTGGFIIAFACTMKLEDFVDGLILMGN